MAFPRNGLRPSKKPIAPCLGPSSLGNKRSKKSVMSSPTLPMHRRWLPLSRPRREGSAADMKRIGLIAGSGQFPLLWARAAKQQGYEVMAVAHVGETAKELEGIADSVVWVRLGELGKIVDAFKSANVTEAVLAGGIRKGRIFTDAKPDWRALALLTRVGLKNDDAVLRALSDELAREGIAVQESTALLSFLLTPKGLLTGRSITPEEEKDIALGFRIVRGP